jgi:SAM-dependent methyltransferase
VSDLNREWWDERAALHGQDDRVYDTASFLGGRSTLKRADHELAGDVTGLSVIHLQCHTGMDTLSWLRAGAADVVGVDFSEVAIGKAREIAESAGLADKASFVVSDIRSVPTDVYGRFDVAFASIGVLCWIDDVDAWMRTAYNVLRPGGRLVLRDLHPLWNMTETVDPLELDFPYVNTGPRTYVASGSYAAPGADTVHNETVEWAHSVGEVVTAAVDAGLVIELLREYVEVESDGSGELTADDDGLFRWRRDGELLPLEFGLRARKPDVRAAG